MVPLILGICESARFVSWSGFGLRDRLGLGSELDGLGL